MKKIPSESLNQRIFKFFFGVEENKNKDLGAPKKFLIVRQHNQFGDLLATVPLFRAIKETYPESKTTIIVSPQNYYAISKNKYLDRIFVFDKKKLFNPAYFYELKNLLGEEYDVAVVPVTVAISFTSNFLARLANAKTRIGAKSLNGRINKYHFFFDRKVKMDWRIFPDEHVSEFGLDILEPFGITTKNHLSAVFFNEEDISTAEKFIHHIKKKEDELLIGFHIGAGKEKNRWSLSKYIELMEKLHDIYSTKFYLTGSSSDKSEIDYVKQNTNLILHTFINKSIPELAAVISKSDLFVTNDTGVMHVAGTTKTPQISIFGPTNPYNWAPLGKNKYFIRKGELIDDVAMDDVLENCNLILEQKNERKINAE